jgi:exosortase/archaeosortase family protein
MSRPGPLCALNYGFASALDSDATWAKLLCLAIGEGWAERSKGSRNQNASASAQNAAPALAPQGRVRLRAGFYVKFVLLLVAFGLLQLMAPELQEPAQVEFARLLAASLTALGWAGVAREDVLVSFPGGAFAIGAECTGVALLALLIAFVFAFPASARARMVGIAFCAVVLFVANMVRLVSCAYVMRYRPEWFTLTHEYAWQIGLVGLTFALIAAWARRTTA